MRSTSPPLVPKRYEEHDHGHSIQRKPVPNEMVKDLTKNVPHPSTVRIVSQGDPDHGNTGQEQRDSVIDDLTAGVSRVNLRNEHHNPKGNNAEHPSLQGRASVETSVQIPRSSLDKPLPLPPTSVPETSEEREKSKPEDNQRSKPSDIQTLERELGVEGQIDLSQTEDADIRTHWKPAVTHQTIREDVHEIEEQQISRDIHVDHVFHRILPVEEVEVLPARHYSYDQNGALQEFSSQRTSRQLDKYIQKGIAKGLEKALPVGNAAGAPGVFTAREFRGDEGDYKQSFQSDGSVRSERWWVHSPQLESGGIASGQTRPFHLGSTNPEDDGWRI